MFKSQKSNPLSSVQMPAPPVNAENPELQNLADACGQGDADAMLRLSEYIMAVNPKMEEAVNMWLLRSAIYGNAEAQDRVRKEKIRSPQFLEKSIISYCEGRDGQTGFSAIVDGFSARKQITAAGKPLW